MSRIIKVPVSFNALKARVRRKLLLENEILKSCRKNSRWYSDLGDFYIINERNCILSDNIDLENLAREMGLIKGFEEISYA